VTRDSRRFLPPEALTRIARLEVLARNVVEGFLSGLHRSPYFGQSVEFAQHREYVAGDEIRRIDWKVWSKTDKYYIKQYEEETNLQTTLLVDLSESMEFGSPQTKSDYACSIAAALTYLLLRQQDSVGLAVFDDAVRARLPQSSKQTQLHSILASLGLQKPQRKTDVSKMLAQIADEERRKGLMVLISDLLTDREGLFKGLKLLRTRGHDVMVFHVLDDAELDFPFAGITRFEGLEESGEMTCDPRALREGYLNALQTYLQDVRRFCASHLVDYQVIRTSEHLDAVLRHYFSHRQGLRPGTRN